MHYDNLQALDDAGKLAIQAIKDYFATPDEASTPADAGKRADRGLILLSRVNSAQGNQLKALALQFQIARAIGIRGEPLRPLLAALNPGSFGEAPASPEA